MDSSIFINITKLIKSQLGLLEFCVLQLIQDKNFKTLDLLLNNQIELREIENCQSLSDFAPNDEVIGEQVSNLIRDLENSGWIKITGDDLLKNLEIRQKFIELVESNDLVNRIDDVEKWYQEYRDLFKVIPGARVGIMGSRQAVIDRLRRFLKEHPQVTKEQVLQGTRRYIATESPKYVMNAEYFLYKQDQFDKTTRSKLEAVLEDFSERIPNDYDQTRNI